MELDGGSHAVEGVEQRHFEESPAEAIRLQSVDIPEHSEHRERDLLVLSEHRQLAVADPFVGREALQAGLDGPAYRETARVLVFAVEGGQAGGGELSLTDLERLRAEEAAALLLMQLGIDQPEQDGPLTEAAGEALEGRTRRRR